MTINPLIVKGIDSLNVPDAIKHILHEIIEVESEISVGRDKQAANMSIKRMLEKYAEDEKVVELCGKHG